MQIKPLVSMASADWNVQAGCVYDVGDAFACPSSPPYEQSPAPYDPYMGTVPADLANAWLAAGQAEIVTAD
jgi:long-subunit fatty acid transport protein